MYVFWYTLFDKQEYYNRKYHNRETDRGLKMARCRNHQPISDQGFIINLKPRLKKVEIDEDVGNSRPNGAMEYP